MCDVMLDIETLGTKPGCVVVSIGAATFMPNRGREGIGSRFYRTLELEQQTERGLTIEGGTFQWWLGQSDEAFRSSFKCETAPVHAFAEFAEWYKEEGGLVLWAQGQDFDPPILAAAMNNFMVSPPWKFYQQRDTRTFYDVARMRGGFNYKDVPRLNVHHNALDDVEHQIECMGEAWKYIVGEKKNG